MPSDLKTAVMTCLGSLPPHLKAQLLKAIKNISMAPAALEALQKANAVTVLAGLLTNQLANTVSPTYFLSQAIDY